jgi:hypothetical protein
MGSSALSASTKVGVGATLTMRFCRAAVYGNTIQPEQKSLALLDKALCQAKHLK